MSYYYQIPYHTPLYLSTRQEIQRSIFELEQKLRRKRQFELNLIKDQFYQQRLRQYQQELRFKLSLAQDSQYRMLVQQKLQKQRFIGRLQHQRIQLEHLDRLDKFRRQKQLLKQDLNKYKIQQDIGRLEYQLRSQEKLRQLQHDDILIKRYQDGTKAHQYNQQMKQYYENIIKNNRKDIQYSQNQLQRSQRKIKSGGKQINQQNQYETTNKPQLEETRTHQKIHSNQKQTKKISFQNSTLKQGLAHTFGQISNKNSLAQKIAKKLRHESPMNNLDISPYQRSLDKSKSPYKSKKKQKSPDRQRSRIDSSKSHRTPPKGNKLNRSRTDNNFQNALKKIQNRLKLSTIVFEDSQFRNIKHQMNHLFMTYDNQCKVRKEVKDKINNNPQILKKHKMVVQ